MRNDYEKENQYLPKNIRDVIENPNRVYTQVDDTYLRLYDGVERMAVMNNYYASKFGSGYTHNNLTNIMSGIAPRLMRILVNKTISDVKYIAKGDAIEEKAVLPEAYLTNRLTKAFSEAIRTGRALMCLYKQDSKCSIKTFNCFRHKIIFDDYDNIIQADMFINVYEDTAFCKYVVVERRYFKENVPYQKFILVKAEWDSTSSLIANKTRVTEFDNIEIVPPLIRTQFKGVVFNKEIQMLGFKDLGVYPIVDSLVNTKFPDININESRFVNLQDKILEIESGNTYKEIDKNIGRGRVVMPSFMGGAISDGIGMNGDRMARTFSTPLDKTFFTQYESKNFQDSSISSVQFDIRADQWRTSIEGDICDCCAAFGVSVMDYDARLLNNGQRTDDEINALTDITINSVNELRKINRNAINSMLETLCEIYGFTKPLAIQFGTSSILNPTKNTNLIIAQLQAGLISQKEAIRRCNPDYTDAEAEEQLKAINEESKAKSITSFDNF